MAGLDEMLRGHRDAITVGRVYGDPFERDGVTVIPAARVMGGGGGGEGDAPDGQSGTGTGFGIVARPAGAYVIRGGEVTWKPAIDVNRIIAGAFGIAALALLVAFRRSSSRRARG